MRGGTRIGGTGRGGDGGAWWRTSVAKVVARFEDHKIGGKDGGLGWVGFFGDLMVAMRSATKDTTNTNIGQDGDGRGCLLELFGRSVCTTHGDHES